MVKVRLKLGFALPPKLLLFFFPRVLTPIPVSRAKGQIAAWRCERFLTLTAARYQLSATDQQHITAYVFQRFCPGICSALLILTPHSHSEKHHIRMPGHLFPTELDILVICPICERITSLFCSPTDLILCCQNFVALPFHTAHKQSENKWVKTVDRRTSQHKREQLEPSILWKTKVTS